MGESLKGPGTGGGEIGEEGPGPRRVWRAWSRWGPEHRAHKPGPAPKADEHVQARGVTQLCSHF